MRMPCRIYFICLSFLLLGCSEDDGTDTEVNLGYEYFPVAVGTFVEYRADSIYHDQPSPEIPGIHDTTTYFIREVIESEILDAEEEPSLRIERFKRSQESDPWVLSDVWLAKRTAENAERLEENVRFVKLAFPIRSSAMWNGNALNTREEWIYRYDSLDMPREYDEMVFPATITVFQREFKNLIDDEYAYEIYAPGVGLIYRYERDLTTQINYVNNPVASNIRLGHEFKWEIVDYGTE